MTTHCGKGAAISLFEQVDARLQAAQRLLPTAELHVAQDRLIEAENSYLDRGLIELNRIAEATALIAAAQVKSLHARNALRDAFELMVNRDVPDQREAP